jgi:hypothetical protein
MNVGGPVLLVEIASIRCRPLEPDLAHTSVGNIFLTFEVDSMRPRNIPRALFILINGKVNLEI